MGNGDGSASRLLTTGQVAELCSVKPDTVRKWIRRGRLKALRTAGGHNRIPWEQVLPYLPESGKEPVPGATPGNDCPALPLRCWEYMAGRGGDGAVRKECRACVVFRIRASWCFEVAGLDCDIGHLKRFCSKSCNDCAYFQRVTSDSIRVLLISPDPGPDLQNLDEVEPPVELLWVPGPYEASVAVGDFHPAFVLVDDLLLTPSNHGLLDALANDCRVPGMKLILLTAPGNDLPGDCLEKVSARIHKPIESGVLHRVLMEFPVESATGWRAGADAELDPVPGGGPVE